MENKQQEKNKEIQEVEYHYKEPQGFWSWWFKPPKGWSLLRIPLGVILLLATVLVGFGNLVSLIDYFRAEPLFTGMLFIILFPVMVAVSFGGAILWGGLLYIPYLVLEKEGGNWKDVFKYIGILLLIVVALGFLNWIIFR